MRQGVEARCIAMHRDDAQRAPPSIAIGKPVTLRGAPRGLPQVACQRAADAKAKLRSHEIMAVRSI